MFQENPTGDSCYDPPEQESVFPDKKMWGKGPAENERKRRKRHGKGKIGKEYHIA